MSSKNNETVILSKGEKIVKWVILFAYLFILALANFDFRNNSSGDEMWVVLLYMYLLLPIFTLIISIYIGKDKNLSKSKLIFILVFGFLYITPMLGWYSLKEIFTSHFMMFVNGMLISAAGFAIGVLIKRRNLKAKK